MVWVWALHVHFTCLNIIPLLSDVIYQCPLTSRDLADKISSWNRDRKFPFFLVWHCCQSCWFQLIGQFVQFWICIFIIRSENWKAQWVQIQKFVYSNWSANLSNSESASSSSDLKIEKLVIYRRFLIRSCYNLSRIIPNNKMIEFRMYILMKREKVLYYSQMSNTRKSYPKDFTIVLLKQYLQ